LPNFSAFFVFSIGLLDFTYNESLQLLIEKLSELNFFTLSYMFKISFALISFRI